MSLRTSRGSKSVNLSEATVDSTLDITSPEVQFPSSKTANLNEATVDGTLDLESDFSPARTRENDSAMPIEPASPTSSASDATIDLDMLLGLADSTSIDATLGLPARDANASPMKTLANIATGVSVVGGSTSVPLSVQGTFVARGQKTGVGGNTAGSTAQGANAASIDFNRSVLSTISKRSLAEKAGPLATPPDYEIVSKLGEGGMGVVYSAIQKTLDRKVAIKAIKAGKATSEESQRKFFYEAQITSDLDHPNIVPIHEMGSNDDGTLFYSMKMVSGTPWEDAILDKTSEENIEIFMKVCDAVAFAHSRNIIHRDLKPENVMLGAFGEVLVMDWGLAVNRNTTQEFGMSGTPVYMAPEMARHDLSKIGKGSDIYILGAILFQIIVGKPPRKGKTVRECIANGRDNINIDPGIEDALLDIANRAMATEPSDRYASVLDFQNAIREHLRFAQSISLTHRAEEILENSIREKDYQGFSRALFSMQDAIEMWPDNKAAKDGLHRTRLAYGQCALDRGDFDLCLQTVDVQQEDEAALHAIGTERKADLVEREKRFKWLRKVLAAVILFAIVSLSIATLYAKRQEWLALKSAKAEEEAKQVAQSERDNARQSAEEERAARRNEEEAKRLAQTERDRAVVAEKQEKVAKELEVVAREQAVASEKTAVRNARLALLGSYQFELNLALNQTSQFDVARSSQLLLQVQAIEEKLAADTIGPSLQNWAYKRIAMLNNGDLPRAQVEGAITAFQIAAKSELGILGTSRGVASVVQLAGGQFSVITDRTVSLKGPIRDAAISPDGEDAFIAMSSPQAEFTVYHWKTKSREAVPVRSLGKRDLQLLEFSPDGNWAVGGINAGLWIWKRNATEFDTEPIRLDCRGSLVGLQFIGGSSSEVFGLSKVSNGKSVCLRADLRTNTVQTYSLPESIETRVSCAAMSYDQQYIYLGLTDGAFLMAAIDSSSIRQVSAQNDVLITAQSKSQKLRIESQVQPSKHTTAIRGIEVHSDGTVLSYSEEPVVHVWGTESKGNSLTYKSYLVGLLGNVTNASFLAGKGDVAATDDLGNLIRWNLSDQDERKAVPQTLPTALVSQAMSTGGNLQTVDRDGVLRISSRASEATLNSEQLSFVGHTPGAKVCDVAVAWNEPLLATIALLPADAETANTSEVCVWNISTREMLHRASHKTSGECRIAFANRDTMLVIGDGKETVFSPTEATEKAIVEKRFGTRLSANHPTRNSLTALIAMSGAVRIVDWQDPSKWDDMGYRFFDIAINNPNAPIEAAWATDGKRLCILFENGRIARFDWDGASLTNLCWTDEIPALRSVEQSTPWRLFDFDISKEKGDVDRLTIVRRTSDSKPRVVQSQFEWVRQESKPRLGQMTSVERSPSSVVSFPGLQPHDVIRTSQNNALPSATIAVNAEGTLNISQAGKTSWSIGRPACQSVSHSRDSLRWTTLLADEIVYLATISERQQVTWYPIKHSFAKAFQAELSADGQRLAIVGRLASGASHLMLFEIAGKNSVTPAKGGDFANVRFVRWHPFENEFVFLDADQNWHRVDSAGDLHAIKRPQWDKIVRDGNSLFLDVQWLIEPKGKTDMPTYHLAILSRLDDLSRIDFLPIDGSREAAFEPIVSRSTITSIATSATESILALGDANGNLGIWFVSPSFDQSPRELYTLPGHRGASVNQLSFSSDDSTILSSDSSKRAIRWRSR